MIDDHKPTLFRIHTRCLSFARENRSEFSMIVAVNSMSEKDAVQFARSKIHTTAWWDDRIITDVQEIGELWAAQEQPR